MIFANLPAMWFMWWCKVASATYTGIAAAQQPAPAPKPITNEEIEYMVADLMYDIEVKGVEGLISD